MMMMVIHRLRVLPLHQLIPRRYLQFSGIQSCQEYLDYCLSNSINTGSTVFKGTLYELYVKSFLEQQLHCTDLVKYGGSYDNGVDVIGRWNLLPYYDEAQVKKLGSKSILKYSQESAFNTSKSPISLANDVQVLVQCKNFKKKPDAKIIRELSGILDFHKFSKKSTVMFIATPLPCTPQAITQLDNTKHAIIHLMISSLVNSESESDNFFALDTWTGGKLNDVYMNRQARALLSGLNLEQQLKYIG
ncbi:Required for respiratory growth protein 7, mitochondrial [Candida viswanathii]|uniref:Required for respiratory growth protein 7, mitochondrial n=1 Tax=Candida viswanathii TaxID=5486 RepID=A0A367YJE7_9ASCO|nr:Required for respiratory growth protein 7, mitochondrial [Candida viswanathii]